MKTKVDVILILLLVGSVKSCVKQDGTTFMDATVHMLEITKLKLQQAAKNWSQNNRGPMDCADLFHMGHNESGLYSIWPVSRISTQTPLSVYCDMDTDGGGWTVLQRRGNFNRPYDYFFKDWKSYKDGFGNVAEDFWFGNDNIFALTNQKSYSVRFDMKNLKLEERFAQYDYFWIDDEFHNYTLHIGGYKGDAGDSMYNHTEHPFSTKDKDNDASRGRICAEKYKSGWWFEACYRANLNGLYANGSSPGKIRWISWTQQPNESLYSSEIKIRPEKFTLPNTVNSYFC